MKEHILTALTYAYIAMSIFSFGYFSNHFCRELPENNQLGDSVGGCIIAMGPLVALFWPLYWSAELQKPEA